MIKLYYALLLGTALLPLTLAPQPSPVWAIDCKTFDCHTKCKPIDPTDTSNKSCTGTDAEGCKQCCQAYATGICITKGMMGAVGPEA